MLVDKCIAGGKQDSDASLGAATGARECRTGKKGSGREGRFPNGRVSEAPVRFLQKYGAPSFEPSSDDAAFESCLVGVRRHQPAWVPSDEGGPCVGTAEREATEKVAQRETLKAGPSGAQGRRAAVEEQPKGRGGADVLETAAEAECLLEP